MRYLVTGGAGFIGSHLVDALIKGGHHVSIIDNFFTGSEKNVNPAAHVYRAGIEYLTPDLIDRIRPDVIFHLAAQANVRESMKYARYDVNTNVIGTLLLITAVNIIQKESDWKLNKFVFSSSGGAIYGETNGLHHEVRSRPDPRSVYGVSKLAAEGYLNAIGAECDIPVSILRFANVYGPRQGDATEAGVVSIFLRSMKKMDDVFIFGDGHQTRDFIYVSDVVDALIRSGERKTVYNSVINIGTSIHTPIKTLFNLCKTTTNFPKDPIYKPGLGYEIYHTALDNLRMEDLLGITDPIDLNTGIQKTWEYIKGE